MPDDLVITGLGLVTPLGVGVDATWASLLAGRYVTDLGLVAEPRDVTRSRVAQLALLAAREATGSRADKLTNAALVVGTSKGPVDEWLTDAASNDRQARDAFDHDEGESGSANGGTMATLSRPARRSHARHAADASFGLASLADEVATDLPIQTGHAPRFTFSAACASGLHALARAALLLRAGDASAAIVVACESSLDPLWTGTFRNLGVLAKPGEPCRPLDTNRSGFVISEASAAVVLERRVAKPGEVVLDACAIASDATHLTGIDPTGRTLRRLIERVTQDRPIDFAHAHATATSNDAVELAAIRATLGDAMSVYSHKGAIGHALGASSLIAVVINAIVHRTGDAPPMRTTSDPIGGLRARELKDVRSSIALAAGFGGALAAAVLRTAR